MSNSYRIILILNFLLCKYYYYSFNKMTKTLSFKPIVLEQKKMKRVTSNSSLATLYDSEQIKLDKNRKIPESVKNYFI